MFTSPIAAWRQLNSHYRLEGNQCTTCKRMHFPAVNYCSCGAKNLEPYCMIPKGILQSFTQVTTPPADFKAMGPYCIGLVELDEGPRLVVQLADVKLDELQIGMRMCGVLRKMFARDTGIIHYGIKFIPAE